TWSSVASWRRWRRMSGAGEVGVALSSAPIEAYLTQDGRAEESNHLRHRFERAETEWPPRHRLVAVPPKRVETPKRGPLVQRVGQPEVARRVERPREVMPQPFLREDLAGECGREQRRLVVDDDEEERGLGQAAEVNPRCRAEAQSQLIARRLEFREALAFSR